MDETSFSQPESSIIVDSKSNSFFDDPTSHPVLEQKYDWEPGKKLEAPLPDPWYDTRFWKVKYKKSVLQNIWQPTYASENTCKNLCSKN